VSGGPTHRTVSVPASRLARWIDGFVERHGGSPHMVDGVLAIDGSDGATARLIPLFPFDGATTDSFVEHVGNPPRCAVLLIRRGGFAAAIVAGGAVIASDVGRRHVQGRTAAGGWSQQRFARRRQKQSDELVDAAVDYAVRVILPALPVEWLVTGGDRPLIDQALTDPRLRPLQSLRRGPHLEVPDPRRDVVTALPEKLSSARIDLIDP
jgi:hypothetical protein